MKKWLASLAVVAIAMMSTPVASMAATPVQAQSLVSAPVTFGFVLQGNETRDIFEIQVAVHESVKTVTFQNVDTSLVQYQLIDSNGDVAASFYNQGYGNHDHLFLNVNPGTYTVRIINMTADTVGGETYLNW